MDNYKSFSDAELIPLFKLGDREAFTEIYSRYWDVLYIHALKMLRDEQEAKDLIQDLFITFWAKASTIELKTNLSGYLYVSARHKILNRIRQKKTNDDFISGLAIFADKQDGSSLDQLTEKEIILTLEKEMEKLPPKMREIFELSRKQYLSYKEIADKLGISDKTVKKQISNAIRIIRPKLDKFTGIVIIFF